MEGEHRRFDHLIRNLERVSEENSIFNYKPGRKAFLSLGQGDILDWLESLLPNTRIILEPKIIGQSIGIQYIDGELTKAINKQSKDITLFVRSLINIPKKLPIKKRIEIRGVLYKSNGILCKNNEHNNIDFLIANTNIKNIKFCAFQIFHCNINQFQALQELRNLNFEIPQTQFSKYIYNIEIYVHFWKEGKLFNSYVTNGIVLKINSRKLQKHLGESDKSLNWAYAIN